MEQSNNEKVVEEFDFEEKVYDYTKSFINNWGAIIFIVFAVIGIILIGSLTGFKEIKAKKSDSSKMIKEWRDNNDTMFPEEYVDIIIFNDTEYYFIIDKIDEQGNIIQWHFAFDSNLTYVFKDTTYWILTALTISLAIVVYDMNAKSTLRKVQDSEGNQKSVNYFAEVKNEVIEDIQYLDDFCEDEYNAIYERELRDIVKSYDLDYNGYKESLLKDDIPKWYEFKRISKLSQKEKIVFKRLKKVNKKRKKINIQKLRSQDIVQLNQSGGNGKKVVLLSDSPDIFLKKKLKGKLFSQLLMTLISGLTASFGIALGDWTVGIAYGFTIISSGVTSIIVTTDYARTTLRQRYIAQANYLKKYKTKIPYYKQKELEARRKEDELARHIEQVPEQPRIESEQQTGHEQPIQSGSDQEHGKSGYEEVVV